MNVSRIDHFWWDAPFCQLKYVCVPPSSYIERCGRYGRGQYKGCTFSSRRVRR